MERLRELWLRPVPERPLTCRNPQHNAKGQPPQHTDLHPYRVQLSIPRNTCSRREPRMMLLPARMSPSCHPEVDHP